MESQSTPEPTSPPKTMQGWTHVARGVPSNVLQLSPSLPNPSEVSGQDVLVKISHAALNPGGSIMMHLCPMIFRTKPSIPEMDFAGTIVSLGPDVPSSRSLKPGSSVFGSVPVGLHVGKGRGSLAEFVVVPAENLYEVPQQMKLEEAAGLPIAGCTSLVLFDAAKVKEGDKVLVYGASGGIGSMTLQMVKSTVGKNGKAIAICSGRNVEMVRELGADQVIDYQEHAPVHEYLMKEFSKDPFDSVIDAFGSQDLWLNCPTYLKPGKPFISVGQNFSRYTYSSILSSYGRGLVNSIWPTFLGGVDRPHTMVTGIANLKDMERLARMVDEGKLKVPIDSEWDFKEVLKAYERILSKHARGKVIVRVN